MLQYLIFEFSMMKSSRPILHICVWLFLLVSACSEGGFDEDADLGEDQAARNFSSETNVFRLLTAVRPDRGFSIDDVVTACEDSLGFAREMTDRRVIDAREIQVPVTAQISFSSKVPVKRAITRKLPPEVEGDVIFEPKEETVYETIYEERSGTRFVTGTCVGTEYILE